MIHADYLFPFTDVDGLYTANPRKDPSRGSSKLWSRPPRFVLKVSNSLVCPRSWLMRYFVVSTATLGSNLGTGGMETKLIAAEIATAAGVSTIITSSRNPASLFAILEYHGSTPGSGSSRANPITKPRHTFVTPSSMPQRDPKGRTLHTLPRAGP